MTKLKVAVIGCGRISIMHLNSIKNIEEIELVGVCDSKKERADEWAERYCTKAYYDYEEMFKAEKLDAVHVCLPHYLHSKVAIDCFNHGINVLIEKPMDVDYENAEKAVKVAKEKGLKFGVIFQCRYNDSAQLVKKRVEEGKLGKILTARSILTWTRPDDYYLGSDWKGTWDKEGGGVVIDQAIHSIDLVHWIVNSKVKDIQCAMFNHGHKIMKVEDTAEGLITYENGVKYGFYAMNNYAINEPIEIKMACENGKVTFGYNDALIEYNNGEKEEVHQDVYTGHSIKGKEYWGYHHIRQIRQFYNAVLGKEELEISGEEALKTHKLIMDLYDIAGVRNKI